MKKLKIWNRSDNKLIREVDLANVASIKFDEAADALDTDTWYGNYEPHDVLLDVTFEMPVNDINGFLHPATDVYLTFDE